MLQAKILTPLPLASSDFDINARLSRGKDFAFCRFANASPIALGKGRVGERAIRRCQSTQTTCRSDLVGQRREHFERPIRTGVQLGKQFKTLLSTSAELRAGLRAANRENTATFAVDGVVVDRWSMDSSGLSEVTVCSHARKQTRLLICGRRVCPLAAMASRLRPETSRHLDLTIRS